jgi:O-antigen/teichoic acid export membrane protein
MENELEIGYFMAAVALVETLYFIPDAIGIAVFPAFSRIYGYSIDALRKTYERMIKYVIIISAAVCVGCILVGGNILLLIYGNEFEYSIEVLNVFIFYWAFMFFDNIMSNLLFSINKENVQVKIMGLACIINVVLNIVLIEQYGYIGSAYAILATEGTIVVIMAGLLWSNSLKYTPDWSILRLTGVIALMIVVVRMLNNYNIVIAILGGAISYVSFLFILRVFDNDDIMYMKSIIRRGAHNVS